MNKKFLAVSLIISNILLNSLAFAGERTVEIKKWEELNAPKGFILSNDLHFVKMCSKIWTFQIKEFKKQNPHVKDPNVISINQKIKVQDCRMEEVAKPTESPVIVSSPIKEKSVKSEESKNLFAIISAEYNSANSYDKDTKKDGYGLKIEAGKIFSIKHQEEIKASVGLLVNQTKSSEKIDKMISVNITADGAYLFKVSDKVKLGPNLGLLAGNKAEIKDRDKSPADIQAFMGVNGVFKLTDKFSIDAKVGNALENRLHLLTTVGLQFNF